METIQGNEQWKLNGDCTKCRRNNYCSKPCTRYNRRANAERKRFVVDTMHEMIGGVTREVIERSIW